MVVESQGLTKAGRKLGRLSAWNGGVTVGLATVVLFFAGCGGDTGVQRASVGGVVTLDGVPVDGATIRFIPVEGTVGPTSGTEISNGEYYLARQKGPPLGKNRVEVYIPRMTGRKVVAPWAAQRSGRPARSTNSASGTATADGSQQPAEPEQNLNPMQGGGTIDEWVEAAPPKYNEKSTLELDVESGHNTFDVHVKSK